MHFLDLADIGPRTSVRLAEHVRDGVSPPPVGPGALAMVTLNRSIRTRLGVADAAIGLGLSPIDLDAGKIYVPTDELETDMARERVSDTARVLAAHARCVAVRAFGPSEQLRNGGGDRLVRLIAEHSSTPVLNMETETSHPIQALADLATLLDLDAPKLAICWAYADDPKPTAVPLSIATAAAAAGIEVRIVAPPAFALPESGLAVARKWCADAGGSITTATSLAHMGDSNVIYMKSWSGAANRSEHMAMAEPHRSWRATDRLLDEIGPRARYMHCLPASYGQEVDASVVDGSSSLVWTQVQHRRLASAWAISTCLTGAVDR